MQTVDKEKRELLYILKLGGIPYTIVRSSVTDVRYELRHNQCEIGIPDTIEGDACSTDVQWHNMWTGILTIMVADIMKKSKKPEYKQFFGSFYSLMIQVIQQVKYWDFSKLDRGDGLKFMLKVGGAEYQVVVANEYCKSRSANGYYNSLTGCLYLMDEDEYGLVSSDFMKRVLIHEAIHAINGEIRAQDTFWDKETTVNVLAGLIMEAITTIKGASELGKEIIMDINAIPKTWYENIEEAARKGYLMGPLEFRSTKINPSEVVDRFEKEVYNFFDLPSADGGQQVVVVNPDNVKLTKATSFEAAQIDVIQDSTTGTILRILNSGFVVMLPFFKNFDEFNKWVQDNPAKINYLIRKELTPLESKLISLAK